MLLFDICTLNGRKRKMEKTLFLRKNDLSRADTAMKLHI